MNTTPDGLLRAVRRTSPWTALRRGATLGAAGLLGAALITATPASAAPPIPDPHVEEPVAATEIPVGEVDWTDPSADQVWTPPEAVESVADAASVEVVDEGADPATDVHVLDDAAADELGVNGIVLQVDPADPGEQGAISVDYAAITSAFGAGWSRRLDAFLLPLCALDDPAAEGCDPAIEVESANDHAAETLTVDLAAATTEAVEAETIATSAEPMLLAVAAASDSDAGDYSATKLNPIGTWEAGSNTGAFTYSIPITVPPAEGPVPELSLSYSSAVHDGRTSGKNNQASWVGDGWSYEPGFIERTYAACSDDRDSSSNNGEDDFTADQCWDGESDHLTASLDGVSATLLKDDDSDTWYVESGAAWKIEKLGSTAGADTPTTERWRITTEDGTRYDFGLVASSRLTVPVFGNHSGEPCHATEFKDSSCKQAYRWMLDTAVDTLGNKARYNYTSKNGYYGAAGDEDDRTAYTREAYLASIEYGLREDDPAVAATGRINFTTADRCQGTCYDSAGKPIETAWPETPWDLHCDAAPCATQYSPVFFETKYLTTITTQVREGTAWRDVDQWSLDYDFKTYGSENQVVLWLKSIQQTAKTGDDLSLPKLEFGGYALANRVEAADRIQLWRWRMSSIKTETGSIISIGYSDPECATLPSKSDNTERCYPTLSKPRGQDETVEDWFHKYVVTEVTQTDPTAFAPAVMTFYDYSTAGSDVDVLWAWDDSAHTRKSERTYRQWRGYAQVTTRVGDPHEGPQQTTRTRFYRGLDGQPLPDGTKRSATLVDAEGNTATDHKALSGNVFESLTYNGAQVVEGSTTRYWTSKRASQSHDGGAYEAWLTGPSREDSRRWIAGDTWQRTRTSTEYDSLGRPTAVTDHGDAAVLGDEKCSRTWYTDSAGANLYTLVNREETVSVACSTSPSRPAHVLTENRYYYDGHTGLDDDPVDGLRTRSEQLASWPDSGSATYSTVETTGYDALGRPTTVKDALDRTTTTVFTPAGAGPVTQTVTTNPAGHTETVTLDPAWGQATKIVDANNRATEIAYDAFGRSVSVWLPGRTRATESASMTFAYSVRDDGPSTITTRELNTADGYITSIELYDAMLRLRETQSDTINGGRVITEQYYDSHGRVIEERGPNYNTESGPTTTIATVARTASDDRVEYRFDAAGRVTDTIQFNRDEELWRTTTAYGGSTDGFQTVTTPPDGAAAEATIEDPLGQTSEIRTYRSNEPTGEWDALSYTYTPLGDVATMTDPAGNQWKWAYDLQGRQVSSTDPDAGTTTTVYDKAGQTTSTTDQRGKTLQFKYDSLGRLIERRDGDGTVLASWTFDTVSGGKGLPATTTRWADGNAYVESVKLYDAAGRANVTAMTIPASEGSLAGTYNTSQSFFDNGQMKTRGYTKAGSMDQQSLRFGYDALGNPTTITTTIGTQSHTIVEAAGYTPFGEISSRRLNSGDSKYAYQNFYYDDTTRRLTRFTFSHETTNPNVADVNYAYDDAGNVQSVVDKPVGGESRWETQCFNYDPQQRLTEAWSQAGDGSCSATSAEATVGGPAAYSNTYAYDAAGNRTSDRLRLTGQPDTQRTFEYAAPGAALPHAPVEVDYGNGDRAVFGYDAAGNTTSRDVNGDVQTFEWDAEGNNTVVNKGDDRTRMVYDPDGERLIRDDGDTVTLFLPDTEIVWNKTAGTLDTTRYFKHAGHVVAVAKGAALGNWRFTGISPQGTATHSISATSESFVTVRYFDPYGINRGDRTGTWYGQQGWVGGVEDPSGLLELGARSYDALFGRFMSIDPVIDVTDDQQINGYAYANHNPVTFADPTGLFLDGLMDKAKDAVDSVANTVSDVAGSASDWVVDNAGTISEVAGVVATVAAFVPGGQVIALAAGAVAIGAGAIETYQACSGGETADCAMGVAGMLPGPAGRVADIASTAYTCATGTGTDCVSEFIPGGRRGADATDGGNSSHSDGDGTTTPGGGSSCNSFVPGTEVLLADGSTIPIESIETGDEVVAADAVTGEMAAAEVIAVLRTPERERELVEITIQGAGGDTVTATGGHHFWVVSAEDGDELVSGGMKWEAVQADWLPARDLKPGSWLFTSDNTWVQVAAVEPRREATETRNLTIAGLHTYFVSLDGASLLVHNGRRATASFDPDATGDHCTWKEDANGIVNYHEWSVQPNPNNKTPFWCSLRVCGPDAGPHFDKATGEYVESPHTHDNRNGTVYPTTPDEMPSSWSNSGTKVTREGNRYKYTTSGGATFY